MEAVVKSHIYELAEGKYVHAVYMEVKDEALTTPIDMDTVKGMVEEAPETVKELRVFRTTCNKIIHGENAGKYVVRAVLRYVGE